MLNGRNGTPIPDREQDFILTAVRACEVRPQFQHLKHPKPIHYKFDIKWGNQKYAWMDYNHTMFTTEPMKKFVRDNLNYKSFKNHYDKEMNMEWIQYRYVPNSKKKVEHFKIVLGDGSTITKTMEQAVSYFGAVGVDNIKRQHSYLSERIQTTQFFFVQTCQPIDGCSGLENPTDCTQELKLGNAAEDSHYKWVQMADDVWIRSTVLKTDGIFCFIAASLNASLFPHSRCIELFSILKAMHKHEGEVSAGWAFLQLKSLVKNDDYCLQIEKCQPVKSFQEISAIERDGIEGNIKIVCYTTKLGTSHAICWDLFGRRILDSEYRNVDIFSYNTFEKNSKKTMQIMDALGTKIDYPCILYTAYWKVKSKAKRKR